MPLLVLVFLISISNFEIDKLYIPTKSNYSSSFQSQRFSLCVDESFGHSYHHHHSARDFIPTTIEVLKNKMPIIYKCDKRNKYTEMLSNSSALLCNTCERKIGRRRVVAGISVKEKRANQNISQFFSICARNGFDMGNNYMRALNLFYH